VLRHRLRHREKVTVLGSLTVSPRRRRCGLYAEFLPGRSVQEADLIAHLRRLRRTFQTPLVVVLDNLNQHKGRELQGWCRKVRDVHLEYLPPYAPELNPVEGVWSHGKCVTAAGCVSDDVHELECLARTAIATAHQPRLLRGFLRATRLPLAIPLPCAQHSI
jgi:putative transposase